MASSPPASPGNIPQRPLSAMLRPSARSNSRMSVGSRPGGGSRASDEDGRTAVKVVVRVRPPLKSTDPGFDLIPQRFQRSMVQVTSNTSLAIDSPQGRKLFVFDRVFGSEVPQDGIWEYVSDCVNSFLQGYNVSLLAYGQSGAGKSYTMGTAGPDGDGNQDSLGVIPRAAAALFERLETPKNNVKSNRGSMSHLRSPRYSAQSASLPSESNWSLKATYVEIYNEQLRDLLIPEHVPQAERTTVSIREDVKGNIIFAGLRQVDITSVDDLMNALTFGSSIRQTDATAINAKSSRSHAVFSLNLVQRKTKSQSLQGAEKRFSVPIEAITGADAFVTTDSKLHFVDLAGSERLKNTGAQGERAKEGISINAGLASLGKVISQLSSRQAGSHVSYRDSKLTRLLQDSLGGNAITYMIACVTPAEFHLSETLNTVQYAQRARAIQSKPRIQQVEEGDRQVIIDRLKAEVAFLREQIRSAERSNGGERRPAAAGERAERSSEREVELQNQLLDSQENYNALSHRHARLIAEMAKARDNEQMENENAEGGLGDTATERLNRSNSFAQAVEQVVLEYEKTIQSLEQSLSSTRGTLSNTEASLLEKETKCAYIETINTQLQARLQKVVDREASTENYLRDLEVKLDGHTSGEEKNATIVVELRKEIARVRENEASCEDYISTLEERLAEADQDAELMQREIDRLEQVVERQRSLGKLDSLLYELDHIQQDGKRPEQESDNASSVGVAQRRSVIEHSRSLSHARTISHASIGRHSHKDVILETDEEDAATTTPLPPVEQIAEEEDGADEDLRDMASTPELEPQPNGNGMPSENVESSLTADPIDYPPQSPAQSKFVADKLETVTQELFDLRVDHETTINEFDILHNKYEEALRALAELQDIVDEARHPNRVRDSILSVSSPLTRPTSFFSDIRSSDTKDSAHFGSSRSLSSELSSALESPAIVDASDSETATAAAPSNGEQHDDDAPAPAEDTTPVDKVHAVEEAPVESVPVEGAPVESAPVEDAPIEKAPVESEPAESAPVESTPVVDEALASELEKFKSLAAAKELAERELAEKYQELEAKHHETLDMVEELKTEVSKARAAEATSPRGNTPVIRRKSSQNVMIIDRAHRSFASLRNIAAENFEDQPDVMQNFELNLNSAMHELHARSERIQELEAGVAAAKKEMETKMTIISGLTRERSSLKASPRDMSVASTLRDQLEENEKQLKVMRESHDAREKELLAEVESLRAALEKAPTVAAPEPEEETARAIPSSAETVVADASPDQSEKIAALETELANWADRHQSALDSMHKTEDTMKTTISELEGRLEKAEARLTEAREVDAAAGVASQETTLKQEELVSTLREEIDKYKGILENNATKLQEIEEAQSASRKELEEVIKTRDLALEEAKTSADLIAALESRVADHEKATKEHIEAVNKLRAEHTAEIERIQAAEQEGYEEQVEVLMGEHEERVQSLEADLSDARDELMKVATMVAFALGVPTSVEKITDHINDLVEDQKALAEEQNKRVALETNIAELSSINDSVMRDLEAVKATLKSMMGGETDKKRTVPEQVQLMKRKMSELEAKDEKNSRLIEELEDQLQSNFDQAQVANNRVSTLQTERNAALEEANAARTRIQAELDAVREEYANLQARFEEVVPGGADAVKRTNSTNSQLRKSSSVASLPSPPPAIPLPPLPGTTSPTGGVPSTPTQANRPGSKDNMHSSISLIHEDQEARIRTIEKHLTAEKQLTATLEEALTDLEKQSNKVKSDCDAWRKRAMELETELKQLKERPPPQTQDNRWSLHAIEEERKKRQAAEAARAHLEERMQSISKKKKKGSLNCF